MKGLLHWWLALVYSWSFIPLFFILRTLAVSRDIWCVTLIILISDTFVNCKMLRFQEGLFFFLCLCPGKWMRTRYWCSELKTHSLLVVVLYSNYNLTSTAHLDLQDLSALISAFFYDITYCRSPCIHESVFNECWWRFWVLPGHGKSKCCIVGNWILLQFLEDVSPLTREVQHSQDCTDLYIVETKQPLHQQKAQQRRANSSGQGSAVHLHLKEKNHSFEHNDVNSLAREDRRFERGVK